MLGGGLPLSPSPETSPYMGLWGAEPRSTRDGYPENFPRKKTPRKTPPKKLTDFESGIAENP